MKPAARAGKVRAKTPSAPRREVKPDPTARLRDAILDGTFLASERLIEEDLARFLKTNRNNVRLALAHLEQEGLVVRERNRGARVRVVSPEEAIEIVEARASLEALVARHAARNATDADIELLREILAELRTLHADGDLLLYARVNLRLHQAILEIAHHSTAAHLLRMLHSQSVSFQYRSIMHRGRADESIREHTALVDAIAEHSPEKAEAVMRDHLEHAVAALRAVISATRTL